MAKLAWFPLYVQDWMADPDVFSLSGDQMGAYLWLLCLQWQKGSLPYEAHMVVPQMPRGISSQATMFVLLKFFPPDPDTNERRNPKLHDIRERQTAAYEGKSDGLSKARKARWGVSQQVSSQTSQQTEPSLHLLSVSEKKGIPDSVLQSAMPFLADPKTRTARCGELRALLQGMRGAAIPPDAVARGVADLAASENPRWTSVAVKRFAERAVKLLEGEAGARAAQSSVLRQSDANQTPSSGWSEDEVEG